MAYELWSSESRNLLATFPTEASALARVRDVATTRGLDYAAGYLLIYENRCGDSRLIAAGETLVQRASAAPRAGLPAAT